MTSVNWEKLWKTKKQSLQRKHMQVLKLLELLIGKSDIKSICDFGCGQGILLQEIKNNFDTISVYGADNNEYSKKIIEQKNIDYINFDLLHDRNHEQFDVGILCDVLEHFHDPSVIIENLSAIPYLIIVVPNFSFITERISVLRGKVPFQMKMQRGGHLYWFNIETLNEFLEKIDYNVIMKMNIYPRKIQSLTFLQKFDNLFSISFGLVLKKNEFNSF